MNINKQMQFYKSGQHDKLKEYWVASDHIRDYDREESIEYIFKFIGNISDKIDFDNTILEYKLVQQELLGHPSIMLYLSDSNTFDLNLVINLDVYHRNKKKYSYHIISTDIRKEFNNIEDMVVSIEKEL